MNKECTLEHGQTYYGTFVGELEIIESANGVIRYKYENISNCSGNSRKRRNWKFRGQVVWYYVAHLGTGTAERKKK